MEKIITIVLIIIVAMLFFWFVPVKRTVYYNCGANWQAGLETGDCSFHYKFTLKDLLFGNSGTLYSK